jgi:hexosaminidase
MRKTFLQIAGLFFFTGLFAATASTKAVADYRVIPLPNEISVQQAPSFMLDENVQIVYPAGNEKMKKNAAFLSQYVKDITAINLKTQTGKRSKKVIILSLGSQSHNPEAYRLTVTSKNITITGASEAGVFYGIQTLRKSIPVIKTEEIEFPSAIINDTPRFAYRGMHLDVSRHFFTVEEVKTYIDILALHNINNFHWHLTDDQGWRIEIKKYPGLTTIGSKRKETVIGHNSGIYDNIPYRGFYTQEQAKDIVSYAHDRYINIIPEIDMPGHMLGALAAYPELGCTGGPYEVWGKWGISENVLCVGNDKTLKFVEDVLNELVGIFPSKYIHIGGDECPKTAWKKCPKCQARIKELGLVTDAKHTAEERLQSYFTGYAEKFLNKKGRTIIGWDEILEGGITPNATVMSWRGMDGGLEAARKKHDVIMTPNTYLYFDYYQSTDIDSEPMAIGGYLPVENVYKFEPQPASLTEEEKSHIIGVQANIWTEYIPTFKQVEYMAIPRIAALSEIQWMEPEQKNYADFLKRIPKIIDFYKLYQYNYATHLYDIKADFNSNPKNGTLDISMSTIDDAPIHYTLDGTIPTVNSPVYSDTLKIKETAKLQAIIFRNDKTSRLLTENINFNKASLKPIIALQPVNKSYEFKGISSLVDGLKGSNNYKSGRWIGFYKNDMDVLIDLGKITTIEKAEINTCVAKGDWIFDTRSFTVEASIDGVNFTHLASEDYPAMKQQDTNGVYIHKLSFNAVQTRYVKITATSEKSIPEWHLGKGKPGFLLVDEIALY